VLDNKVEIKQLISQVNSRPPCIEKIELTFREEAQLSGIVAETSFEHLMRYYEETLKRKII